MLCCKDKEWIFHKKENALRKMNGLEDVKSFFWVEHLGGESSAVTMQKNIMTSHGNYGQNDSQGDAVKNVKFF